MKASFPEEGKLSHLFKRIQLLKRNGLLEESQSSAGKADLRVFAGVCQWLSSVGLTAVPFPWGCFVSLGSARPGTDGSELALPFRQSPGCRRAWGCPFTGHCFVPAPWATCVQQSAPKGLCPCTRVVSALLSPGCQCAAESSLGMSPGCLAWIPGKSDCFGPCGNGAKSEWWGLAIKQMFHCLLPNY